MDLETILLLAVEYGPQILVFMMAGIGVLLLPLNVLLFMKYKGLYRVMVKILLHGGKMDVHTRGIAMDPVWVAPTTTTFELEDKDGRKSKFELENRAVRLFCGIPTTFSIDAIARTFAPDQIPEMALDMANTHIRNLKAFGTPIRDKDGNIINDKDGNPKIVFPIDQTSPDYEYPEFLSGKEHAEQIEMETIITNSLGGDKDRKLLYGGIVILLAFIGIMGLALILIYAPQTAPAQAQAGQNVATTLTNPALTTTTTIPLAPPPGFT